MTKRLATTAEVTLSRASALMILLLTLTDCGTAMIDQDIDTERPPPVTSEHERAAPVDTALLRACMSLSAHLVEGLGWELGAPDFTHSDKWGSVLRLDFRLPGKAPSNSINRMICWRAVDGEYRIVYASYPEVASSVDEGPPSAIGQLAPPGHIAISVNPDGQIIYNGQIVTDDELNVRLHEILQK